MLRERDSVYLLCKPFCCSNIFPDGSLELKIGALDVVQQVKKVLANSLYGCLGTPNFLFYDPVLPIAVTSTGKEILHTAHNSVNDFLNKTLENKEPKEFVIAADTDSVYVDLNDIVLKEQPADVTQFLDDYAKNSIQKAIQDGLSEFTTRTNVRENHLFFKRESIALTSFFTRKKRYAMSVIDKEGVRYTKPEIVIKGLETQRTTIPKFVREALKQAITIILHEDNETLVKFIKNFEKEYKAKSVREIAIPKGCNNQEKYSNRPRMEGLTFESHPIASVIDVIGSKNVFSY